MALARDLSTLPKPAKVKADAWSPDAAPRFVHLLVEQWAAEDAAAGSKPRAFSDARFRHSDAGACARKIALAALNVTPSNPMDLTGTWNTRLGTMIHEAWQDALQARYPDALVEPKMRSVDGQGAGHADAFLVTDICDECHGTGDWSDSREAAAPESANFVQRCPRCDGDGTGHTVLFELKTIGGFGFKMAVGERGAAQGPKFEHVAQTALNAKGMGADEIVIGYLSKEAMSVAVAARKGFDELGRFCAEWSMPADEFLPIAAAEEQRVAGILELLDGGELAARKIPSPELPRGAVIVDPTVGRWEVRDSDGLTDTGTFWACQYCNFQDLCTTLESGRMPIPVELKARPNLTVVPS